MHPTKTRLSYYAPPPCTTLSSTVFLDARCPPPHSLSCPPCPPPRPGPFPTPTYITPRRLTTSSSSTSSAAATSSPSDGVSGSSLPSLGQFPSTPAFDIGDDDLTLLDANLITVASSSSSNSGSGSSGGSRRTPRASDQPPQGSRRAEASATATPTGTPRRLRNNSSSSDSTIGRGGAGASWGGGDASSSTTTTAAAAAAIPTGASLGAGSGSALEVSPKSVLWFAYRKYRLVVCLDLSASMCTGRWWGIPVELFVDATMKYIQVRRTWCGVGAVFCFVAVCLVCRRGPSGARSVAYSCVLV